MVLQATFPLHFRQIHVINHSTFLQLGYNMIKPFLDEQVKKTIIFHQDHESFYEYVDKEILPEELGGTQGAFDNAAASKAVNDMSKYFVQVQNYVNQNANV